MADPRADEIAREAARLIQIGRTTDIDIAVRTAADALGYSGVPLPGHGRVRKHAQAMSMQAMGEAAYLDRQVEVWNIAEQVMTMREHALPDSSCALVGRAAQGHIDAGMIAHIRIYTAHTDAEIARVLVEFGYKEPTFQTLECLRGRVQQVRFIENGCEIVITRCMPQWRSDLHLHLVTGRPLEALTLDALRRRIAERAR